MIRSPLFWKLFIGFTAINLLTALALVSVSWDWYERRLLEQDEAELRRVADLVAEQAPSWLVQEDRAAASTELKELAERIGLSLVVVDAEGAPLSDAPNERLIRAARDASVRGQVLSMAPDRTLDRTEEIGPANDLFALRVEGEEGETLGAIALLRPVEDASAPLRSLGQLYTMIALVSVLLVIGVGYGVVAHIVRPLRVLNRAADSMAGGDYGQRAYVPNRDELGSLAQAFNRMGKELGQSLSELRESDRRQATVLGGMIEGVIAIDDHQYVLFANSAAGKLFGFEPNEVQGRPMLEVARNHALHQAVVAVIDSRRPQRLEINWQELTLSVQVTPLVGDPAAGAVVVLHDTTELRRLETLRRDFIANVSHELKTPLSSIKAYAETLQQGAMDDERNRARFLGAIVDQSDRLDDLIRDMLNLARIESAQQPFEIRSVAVADAVNDCLRDYQPRADAKQVGLQTDAPTEPLGVKADPKGLRVILGNLIDNAIKYTPDGGEVRVRWRGQDSAVRIDVIDNGVGIPQDKTDRVFERFFRVDEARSREMGGTGLGLSIVKHLSQSFGGAVGVESTQDEGTTFSVTLPGA